MLRQELLERTCQTDVMWPINSSGRVNCIAASAHEVIEVHKVQLTILVCVCNGEYFDILLVDKHLSKVLNGAWGQKNFGKFYRIKAKGGQNKVSLSIWVLITIVWTFGWFYRTNFSDLLRYLGLLFQAWDLIWNESLCKVILKAFVEALNLEGDPLFYKVEIRASPIFKNSQETLLLPLGNRASISFFDYPLDNRPHDFELIEGPFEILSVALLCEATVIWVVEVMEFSNMEATPNALVNVDVRIN